MDAREEQRAGLCCSKLMHICSTQLFYPWCVFLVLTYISTCTSLVHTLFTHSLVPGSLRVSHWRAWYFFSRDLTYIIVRGQDHSKDCCASLPFAPFYHPSTLHITHVRKSTRPTAVLKGNVHVGLGARLSHTHTHTINYGALANLHL